MSSVVAAILQCAPRNRPGAMARLACRECASTSTPTRGQRRDGDARPTLVRAAAEAGLDVVGADRPRHRRGLGRGRRGGGRGRHHARARAWRSAPGTTGARACTCSAYLPDPTYPPLAAALDRILDGRSSRVPAICRPSCSELGIDVTEEDVRRRAAEAAATGRPHVADAMVAPASWPTGTRRSRRFLNPGRPGVRRPLRRPAGRGDRPGRRAPAESAVIAHPWGRGAGRRAAPRRRWPTFVPRSGRHRGRPPGPRARRRATGCGRSRATSTWSSPVPATTTAPARSTTTSAATRRRRRSTSGCSTSPLRPLGQWATGAARARLTSYLRPIDWNRCSTLVGTARVSVATPCTARRGSRRSRPCRSRRARSSPGTRRRAT